MTQKTKLIDRILGKKAEAAQGAALASPVPIVSKVSKDFTRFDRFPGYEKMLVPKAAAERFGLANPFLSAMMAWRGLPRRSMAGSSSTSPATTTLA